MSDGEDGAIVREAEAVERAELSTRGKLFQESGIKDSTDTRYWFIVVATYWQDYEVDGGGLQRYLTATVRDAQGGRTVSLARKFTPRTDNFLLQAEVAQYVQASQDTEPPPGVLPKRSKVQSERDEGKQRDELRDELPAALFDLQDEAVNSEAANVIDMLEKSVYHYGNFDTGQPQATPVSDLNDQLRFIGTLVYGALGRRVTCRRDLTACTYISGFGWALLCAFLAAVGFTRGSAGELKADASRPVQAAFGAVVTGEDNLIRVKTTPANKNHRAAKTADLPSLVHKDDEAEVRRETGLDRRAAVARCWVKRAGDRLEKHVTLLTHVDVTPACPFVVTGKEKSRGVFSVSVAFSVSAVSSAAGSTTARLETYKKRASQKQGAEGGGKKQRA
jgi:hypothetical protein